MGSCSFARKLSSINIRLAPDGEPGYVDPSVARYALVFIGHLKSFPHNLCVSLMGMRVPL